MVACVVAVGLVLAGCGGGGDQAKRDQTYITSVNAAMQRFAQAAKALPSGFKAATLKTYSATLDRAATSLRRIEPPDSVATLHQRLTSDVSGYAAAIEKAAQAPLSSNPNTVLQAQQQLLKETNAANSDVNRTLTAIGKKLDAGAS
jgi:outer membrane murein-binding lipoprotein Lpp